VTPLARASAWSRAIGPAVDCPPGPTSDITLRRELGRRARNYKQSPNPGPHGRQLFMRGANR